MLVIRLKSLVFRAALTIVALCLIITAGKRIYGALEARPGMGSASAEYTLIVDPGHGGMDGGAESAGGVCEKNINLAIGEKVFWMARLFGLPCVMTRYDDRSLDYHRESTIRQNKSADLRARAEFAQTYGNPVFISIHLNKFEESRYKGAQTFYAASNPLSRELALLLQKELIARLDPQNNRTAKPADTGIYLMRRLVCPAVIVECGFLSNPEEAERLQQDDYQKKIAAAVFSGYLEFLKDKSGALAEG